jgi:hypothetical protein
MTDLKSKPGTQFTDYEKELADNEGDKDLKPFLQPAIDKLGTNLQGLEG